jgi:hypothetical protein
MSSQSVAERFKLQDRYETLSRLNTQNSTNGLESAIKSLSMAHQLATEELTSMSDAEKSQCKELLDKSQTLLDEVNNKLWNTLVSQLSGTGSRSSQ